ncbi:DUF2989 domain-containing protein [Thalassotalea sp. LPB0316]|uniref:DUF2989 domain-containing protein n=1 Tax=Thalassotalea sp. LPB0316 TaxID=2769490 RepID=UPI001868D8AB|nr:DUF2989 domain-containing protein [Thalassotalea sp. LPB0316]QOL25011.1 DUF2989 domain-containing protein [Thalassotalea sp. LPB0316]
MRSVLPLIIGVSFLSGCEQGPTIATMCAADPQICLDIHDDNWCRKERKALLLHNYNVKQTNDDADKYKELLAYEDYIGCMSLASQIEHIKLKEKKTNRVNSLLNAERRFEQLAQNTKTSDNPYLLYFHWSRFLDEDAMNKFTAMEGSAALETPELQQFLASYYIKRDPDKTLGILFHSLELTPSGAQLNHEVFESIANIFNDKDEHKQTYIWLKVLQLYKPDDQHLNQALIAMYVEKHGLDINFLDTVATVTLKNIEEGKFKAPQY